MCFFNNKPIHDLLVTLIKQKISNYQHIITHIYDEFKIVILLTFDLI
jgi:hypothetical protein